ncbi:MAG: hypothetical protein WB762_06355 [Candidatus Sulfotelmatobacter sp.]
MVDGGYDRIVELNQDGKILGASGAPGPKLGRRAWAHFMAIGPERTIYVADGLNWRFEAFARTAPTNRMAKYTPSVGRFWGGVPSVDWSSQPTAIPFQSSPAESEPLPLPALKPAPGACFSSLAAARCNKSHCS